MTLNNASDVAVVGPRLAFGRGGRRLVRDAAATPDAGTEGLRAIASFERPEPLARPGKTFYKSVAIVKENRTFLIASAYNEDRFVAEEAAVTVSVPDGLVAMGGKTKVSSVALTRTNSVCYRLREDLAAAGLLKDEFKRAEDRPEKDD